MCCPRCHNFTPQSNTAFQCSFCNYPYPDTRKYVPISNNEVSTQFEDPLISEMEKRFIALGDIIQKILKKKEMNNYIEILNHNEKVGNEKPDYGECSEND